MINHYRPCVRIGNWFEDMCMETDKMRVFKEKRARGELLVDKSRHFYDNFYRKIKLNAPNKVISFGDLVQLIPVEMSHCHKQTNNYDLALSVGINETVVRKSQCINEDCEITIAPSAHTIVRNTFNVVSADETNREGQSLLYGQPFRLECVDSEGPNDVLYLYSAQKLSDFSSLVLTTFTTYKHGECNLPLGLIKKKNIGAGKIIPSGYTKWVCHNSDVKLRFETNGTAVNSSTPLVITHLATNKNIAAENVAVQTLFGPEYLASCQNYRNKFKRDASKNIWMINNGQNAYS